MTNPQKTDAASNAETEYKVERLYRDARIRRIFEGTNEINRTLVPTMLIRRASKGDLVIIAAFVQLDADEIAAHKPQLVFVDENNRQIELRSHIPTQEM